MQVPSAPTSLYKSRENYILFPLQMTSGENIYLYIYILFLCMQKEIIGQIMILRKSKTFAIGWVRGFSFQLPETTRKKIYKVMKHLGHIPIQPGQIHVWKVGEFRAYCAYSPSAHLVVFLSAAKLVRFLLVLLVISNHQTHNEWDGFVGSRFRFSSAPANHRSS